MNLNIAFYGCDNIYLGNILTQHTLCEKFYFEMDKILSGFCNILHQEFIVPALNDNITFYKYEISKDDYDYLIVGCGLSGIVMADQ